MPAPRTEGEDNGEWIIVDCGAAVVHVMQPAIREYYHLEELWGDKPVRDEDRRGRAAAPGQGERPSQNATRGAARSAPRAARSGARPSAAERRRRRSEGRQAGAGQARRGGARRPASASCRTTGVKSAGREGGVGPAPRAAGARRRAPSAEPRAAHGARRADALKLVLVAVGQRMPGLGRRRLRRLRQALAAGAAARAEGGQGRAARSRKTPAQLMAAEARRIEAALPRGARRVALDERGAARDDRGSSPSGCVAWQRRRPRRGALIGGPDGLDPGAEGELRRDAAPVGPDAAARLRPRARSPRRCTAPGRSPPAIRITANERLQPTRSPASSTSRRRARAGASCWRRSACATSCCSPAPTRTPRRSRRRSPASCRPPTSSA